MLSSGISDTAAPPAWLGPQRRGAAKLNLWRLRWNAEGVLTWDASAEGSGGLMAAGMKDVASLAGVAVGTVSNVLNHPDLVRPLTRARGEAAMEQLGFIPNGSARQLRAGRSRCLGLVVLDVTNPFFTEVARGAEDYAKAAGYAVILHIPDEGEDEEQVPARAGGAAGARHP